MDFIEEWGDSLFSLSDSCGSSGLAQLPRELHFYFLCGPGHISGFRYLYHVVLIFAVILSNKNVTPRTEYF